MGYGNFSECGASLILLSGLPGTGKTTFAHALAQVLDFEHVESDAIRRGLAREPTYSRFESAAVFAKAEEAARNALKAGRHALIDATNLTVRDRRRFVLLAEELQARQVAMRLVAPEETVRTRLLAPRSGYSQADYSVYKRMAGRAELFGVPVVVVDTRFELEPAVALVASLAQAAGDV